MTFTTTDCPLTFSNFSSGNRHTAGSQRGPIGGSNLSGCSPEGLLERIRQQRGTRILPRIQLRMTVGADLQQYESERRGRGCGRKRRARPTVRRRARLRDSTRGRSGEVPSEKAGDQRIGEMREPCLRHDRQGLERRLAKPIRRLDAGEAARLGGDLPHCPSHIRYVGTQWRCRFLGEGNVGTIFARATGILESPQSVGLAEP